MVSSMAWATPAGTACTPMADSDKAVVETALGTWWTSFKGRTSTQISLREYRWYDYAPIISRPGPVDRVTAVAQAGTVAAARNPDQIARTQTFKTASRKHWGRWYLPNIRPADVDTTYGRQLSASVTSEEGFTRTLLQTSGGSGLICPVVASIQYKAVLGITQLQQDDILDVVRRRRAKVATFRASHTS